MNIEWNAGDYHKNFSFVYKYGEELLNLFTLQKGARVADVGCGSAVLTIQNLPYSILTGEDVSQAIAQYVNEAIGLKL